MVGEEVMIEEAVVEEMVVLEVIEVVLKEKGIFEIMEIMTTARIKKHNKIIIF